MEKKDNSKIQNRQFGDIHGWARKANEATTPSWWSSTTESENKPKKRKKRTDSIANTDPLPNFSFDKKGKTCSKEPEVIPAVEESSAETIEPPKDLPVKKEGSSKKAKSKTFHEAKENENSAPAKLKTSAKASEPSCADSQPAVSPSSDDLSVLWRAASASKAGKFAASQVWIDKELYRQIEAFNLRCGKSVPTKHVINAILRMFIDGHKAEIQKTMKRT